MYNKNVCLGSDELDHYDKDLEKKQLGSYIISEFSKT